ncbi:hypothetical protein T02_13262 [Trichinella nativa]|uniref:Uncharacterized protein n=1 Tax=Trichinella nativa TaxID=6335 RepID=A0A0V1L4K1_9BILA|nr:hypothetical protein T02_13262 [Trichinella nativa]
MDYIINIEIFHTPALVYVGLMALPSIGPEICVASLITESNCAGFWIPHSSLVVRVAISAIGEYFCRKIEDNKNKKLLHSWVTTVIEHVIRNHVDKYAITEHYHQLMPLSLATLKRQGSYGSRRLWRAITAKQTNGKATHENLHVNETRLTVMK